MPQTTGGAGGEKDRKKKKPDGPHGRPPGVSTRPPSARIGGRPVPAAWTPEGKAAIPGTAIENRGRISIARGALSISGPEAARYPLEVAAPTVVTNKGTITAAGGNIRVDSAVRLDNVGAGRLSADGGRVFLGGTTGATVTAAATVTTGATAATTRRGIEPRRTRSSYSILCVLRGFRFW